METRATESVGTCQFRDAILVEIFKAYEESGIVYQKTTNPEIRQTVLDLKRCYDLAIRHLSPLPAHTEKRWDELGARFSG